MCTALQLPVTRLLCAWQFSHCRAAAGGVSSMGISGPRDWADPDQLPVHSHYGGLRERSLVEESESLFGPGAAPLLGKASTLTLNRRP